MVDEPVRRRRLRKALVVAALLGAASARAQGTGATAELEWITESPSDCVTRERFEQRTAEEAGRPVFVEAGADVTITVVLIRVYDPDGWRASVTARTADGKVIGTRELTNAGDSCALSDKLALIVALMVDPGLGATPATPPEPEPAPPPESSRHPAQPPVVLFDEGPVDVAPSFHHPRLSPSHVELDGFGVGGFGMLPHLAVGAELGLTLHPPWFWAVRVGVTGYAEQTEAVDVGEARFRLLSGTLALCPQDEIGALLWTRICGGLSSGPFWVQTTGLQPSRRTVFAAFQASFDGTLGVRVGGGWYLAGQAEGSIPIMEKRYVVDLPNGSRRTVFRMKDATIAVGVGLGVMLK